MVLTPNRQHSPRKRFGDRSGEPLLPAVGEIRCMDAKQAVLLGVHACELELVCFVEQYRCNLTERALEAEARQRHWDNAIAELQQPGDILLVCK